MTNDAGGDTLGHSFWPLQIDVSTCEYSKFNNIQEALQQIKRPPFLWWPQRRVQAALHGRPRRRNGAQPPRAAMCPAISMDRAA